MENIKDGIEAILFAVGRSVTAREIGETLGVNIAQVEEAIRSLMDKYNKNDCGISMLEVDGGVQLVSNKKYFDYVSKFVENSKKQNLSNTCMEVLSIIAYNSKITKSEIEKIRGVNSDSQVSRLLEFGLIEEVGRLSLPGRPAVFSVTNEFLKCMGIKNVTELPEYGSTKSEDETLTLFKEGV